MGTEFFAEREVIAVNFGPTELVGKFSSIYKDEATGISFIRLKDGVMILTQMTEKGLAHNMISITENGSFSDEVIFNVNHMGFIRRVSPLGGLYRNYIQVTSKITLP